MLILYFDIFAFEPFSMDIHQAAFSQVLTDVKEASGTYWNF